MPYQCFTFFPPRVNGRPQLLQLIPDDGNASTDINLSDGDAEYIPRRGIRNPREIQKAANELKFLGDSTLPTPSKVLNDTPLQYFNSFFPDEIVNVMMTESSMYPAQCRPEKPISTSLDDLQQFVGMALYMSIMQRPSARGYWSPSIGHTKISDVMSLNR